MKLNLHLSYQTMQRFLSIMQAILGFIFPNVEICPNPILKLNKMDVEEPNMHLISFSRDIGIYPVVFGYVLYLYYFILNLVPVEMEFLKAVIS